MTKWHKCIGCALAALAFLAMGWAFAEAHPTAGPERDIVVLFTSDVHCGMDKGFGYVGLKAVRDALESDGSDVLLVDNGDAIQGETIGLLTQGEAIIDMMDQMDYDVAIPGNHEFDYGMERFLALAETAEFPYVSCNFNCRGELVFEPYVILEAGGARLAFVGVTTPGTLTSSTPSFFRDGDGNTIYGFMQGDDGAELYAAVQRSVDAARAEGAQYVILLAHLGNSGAVQPYTYADVIEHTSGIDAVLDGHSHDTDKVAMKNAEGETVLRQACGTKLEGIGWLRIAAADGGIDTGLHTWNNSVPAPQLLGIQNDMSGIVDGARAWVDDLLGQVVGVCSVELTINDPDAVDDAGKPVRIIRRAETNLGDLIADAFRARSGADVAVVCGGSIRMGMPMGEIAMKDVLAIYPFGNRVLTAEVTGRQILDALEWGARIVPEESGGFLQVSGMTYEIHTDIESGCQMDGNGLYRGVEGEYRVKNVMIGGEPLEPDKVYTVTSQDYTLLNNGDGQTAFDGARVVWQADVPDYGVVAAYIQEDLKGIVGEEYADPYGQGRIVAVGAEAR